MKSTAILSIIAAHLVMTSGHATSSSLQDLVRSVCGRDQHVDMPPRVGKAGPKGDVGPAGAPGVVNMTAIEKLIDMKIATAFEKHNNASLKKKLATTVLPTTTTAAKTAKGCGDIVYDVNELRNDTGDIFQIHPSSVGLSPLSVYCDVKTDGGGWLVFQRRIDGFEDFYRGWDDYVNGFGDKRREFWLGLETLHRLTQNSDQELRIDVIMTTGIHHYAKYRNFKILSSSDFYRLEVNGYSGNHSDLLAPNNNKPFTTKDADHDDWKSGNCAVNRKGAWWYYWCTTSNLNAKFNTHLFRWGNPVRFSEMKIRQRN